MHDQYWHDDIALVYVVENCPGLGCDTDLFNSQLLGCNCSRSGCSPGSCPCLSWYDRDQGAICGGDVENGGGITTERRQCGGWHRECGSTCTCSSSCSSRIVQREPVSGLQVFPTGGARGLGLRTSQPLAADQFVCFYAGEVIGAEEAGRRFAAAAKLTRGPRASHKAAPPLSPGSAHTESDSLALSASDPLTSDANSFPDQTATTTEEIREARNYILAIRECYCHALPTDGSSCTDGVKCHVTYIDATCVANIGRYANHSCRPNMRVIPVRVDSSVPHAALFTTRAVSAGEELTYSYGAVDGNSLSSVSVAKRCLCGEAECCGFLPYDLTV